MTIQIVLLILAAGLRVVAQGAPDLLGEARKETQRRVLEDAAETIDPELLKPYEITTKETVTRSPETGKVIFVNVNTYRGGTHIENHCKRDSERTGELDHCFQRFYVNGKVIAFINRHTGTATTIRNSHGVIGQAGLHVLFTDDDRDGVVDGVLIMDDSGAEPRMVEAYRVGEDGFYVPASAEEYYRATRHLHAVAPIASVVTGAIEDATKEPGREGPPEKVPPAAGPVGWAP
ncbi:MAG: hypothetical protein GX595_05805 [Lentisphaerae bacterium]|nr:hypothetical protein [Lentisphaerota bacterium]